MHNPATVLENDTHKLLISARRPDIILFNKKKKKNCKTVDFAVPVDHRIKLRECIKKYKYLDLAMELKKLCNMKVTIIPIVIGAFGTVPKGLLKGTGELGSWRTTRILRRVWETWRDLLTLKLQSKTIKCEKL